METLEKYKIVVDNVPANVEIRTSKSSYTPVYDISIPEISSATEAVLDKVKENLIENVKLKISEITDPKMIDELKEKFMQNAVLMIRKQFKDMTEEDINAMAGLLVQEMVGLGKLEFLLKDPNLEEVVVNNSKEPIEVYHKKHGWLVTNLRAKNEEQILNWASSIGRKIGRNINTLNPLLDAHLQTGDRVNATLFPISTKGNTLTIRKFSRSPWTITHMLSPEFNTLSLEMASLIWLAMQYELNIIFAGGTASGKTTLMNCCMPFIPSNQRIISIEDTRELQLPSFLHWIPLTTREPNPEGKGEVDMLKLLINSLRMRPDRLVFGEIRRRDEAEVLFEAMHTGHSVYSTLHADLSEDAIRRLTNPPLEISEQTLESLDLIVTSFRQRRIGVRKVLQLSEVIPRGNRIEVQTLHLWRPKTDNFEKIQNSIRFMDKIQTYTGMSDQEIQSDLRGKQLVLKWMLKKDIKDVNKVGRVIALYYQEKEGILDLVKKSKDMKYLEKVF